jgi:hypothetical protein
MCVWTSAAERWSVLCSTSWLYGNRMSGLRSFYIGVHLVMTNFLLCCHGGFSEGFCLYYEGVRLGQWQMLATVTDHFLCVCKSQVQLCAVAVMCLSMFSQSSIQKLILAPTFLSSDVSTGWILNECDLAS